MKEVDYLLVGQGIAGTMLSYFLLKEGKSIMVIDAGEPQTPSLAAGAIINPVTGRKTLKSWRIDELLPVAIAAYRDMEQMLGVQFCTQLPIHKYFSNPADQAVITPEKLVELAGHATLLDTYDPNIKETFGGIEVQQSHFIDTRKLIPAWRRYMKEMDCFIEANINYSLIDIQDNKVSYQETTASKIIFCEGGQIANNPWFNYLPLNPAKGEALIIEMPGLSEDSIVQKGLFLLPIGNQQFYVGSTNQWKVTDPAPSIDKRLELEAGIAKITDLPFTVVSQLSGLRPNVKDRRPLIGLHPLHSTLAIFNGMGTKGYSLSPWCAQMMVNHLEHGLPLDVEVNIARFGKA